VLLTTKEINRRLIELLKEDKLPTDQREAVEAAVNAVGAVEEIVKLLSPGGDPDGEVNGGDFIDDVTAELERNGFVKSGEYAPA
jgi:hypothetical protein